MPKRKSIPLVLALLCLVVAPGSVPAEEDGDPAPEISSQALDRTHTVTLILSEGGESFEFAMTVASRHFTLNLGEKDISFHGRLWTSGENRLMLDYSLEYTQWVGGERSAESRRGSTWSGSAYLETGRPVELVRFLSGSFTVRIDPVD